MNSEISLGFVVTGFNILSNCEDGEVLREVEEYAQRIDRKRGSLSGRSDQRFILKKIVKEEKGFIELGCWASTSSGRS